MRLVRNCQDRSLAKHPKKRDVIPMPTSQDVTLIGTIKIVDDAQALVTHAPS
jgi:hypothetical protein